MSGQSEPNIARADVTSLQTASITEQAAEWYLRLRSSDVTRAEQTAYLQWLVESRVHVAETLRVAMMHSRLHHFMRVGPHKVALDPERARLKLAWRLITKADERDLVLWTQDSVPPAPRIAAAVGIVLNLPESTLRVMSSYARELRSKRIQRVWWILGIVATGLLSPLVYSWLEKTLGLP